MVGNSETGSFNLELMRSSGGPILPKWTVAAPLCVTMRIQSQSSLLGWQREINGLCAHTCLQKGMP